MTKKERLQTVLSGQIPDCVPASPDFSNMIPAKLTGKPFWDLYLYNDPPIWDAYIDCAKHFDIDILMDGYFRLTFDFEKDPIPWEKAIVYKDPSRIITRKYYKESGKYVWKDTVDVYYVDNPPSMNVDLLRANVGQVPDVFQPLEGVKPVDMGEKGLKSIMDKVGDNGLVGVFAASTVAISNARQIYEYYDNPDKHEQWAQERLSAAEKKFEAIMNMETRPDFICVGGSGTLVFQTIDMFRQLALPAVKRVIELATKAGIPTHVHSCGPETQLVKLFAQETSLTVIDPLEISPMGDCNLAELKKLYGDKIVLKGNIQTTDVMLYGSKQDVIDACKKAIDDAAAGGRFILSTGDQCGRDTPEENIHALVETARTYGRY